MIETESILLLPATLWSVEVFTCACVNKMHYYYFFFTVKEKNIPLSKNFKISDNILQQQLFLHDETYIDDSYDRIMIMMIEA